MDKKKLAIIQFTAGILVAITGAILMFLGILPVSVRITMGIVGIALIATSNFRFLK